jgi:hypothetical protein
MIIGLVKIVSALVLNAYVVYPIGEEACNQTFKNTNASEKTELATRAVVSIGGGLTSIIVTNALVNAAVDAIGKKGTEEAVKGFIRAII